MPQLTAILSSLALLGALSAEFLAKTKLAPGDGIIIHDACASFARLATDPQALTVIGRFRTAGTRADIEQLHRAEEQHRVLRVPNGTPARITALDGETVTVELLDDGDTGAHLLVLRSAVVK